MQNKTKTIENKTLIARRIPPGDKWRLADEPEGKIHQSLTEALEAYMVKTGFKGDYRLEPLNSSLYAITTEEQIIEPPKEKLFNLYGEYGQ
jgi:hypothetical protein|tara:strand:- start:1973 stop:2245 length:273 start_codon:yes stop_codon:yes gene_type:complete